MPHGPRQWECLGRRASERISIYRFRIVVEAQEGQAEGRVVHAKRQLGRPSSTANLLSLRLRIPRNYNPGQGEASYAYAADATD